MGTCHDVVNPHPGKIKVWNPVFKKKMAVGVTVTLPTFGKGVVKSR